MSDQTFCPSKPHLHISSNFRSKFWPFPLFLTIAWEKQLLTPSWKSHFFPLGHPGIFPEYSDGNVSIGTQPYRPAHKPCSTTTTCTELCSSLMRGVGGCMQFKGWCHLYDAHNPDTLYIAMVFVSQRKVAGCWDLVWMAGWAIIIPPYSTCKTCIWRIYCTRKNSHLRMADPAAAKTRKALTHNHKKRG